MNGHTETIRQFGQVRGGSDDFRMASHTPLVHYALRNSKCLLHYEASYKARMLTPSERLKIARENSGFATASLAAESMGIPIATYTQHENGTRGIPAKAAPRYARKFKVSEEWLLYGKGDGPALSLEPSEADLERLLAEALDELPVSAKIGDWPRLVAGVLHAQLTRFRADREASQSEGEKPAPDTPSQSRAPTSPNAEA